MTTFRGMNAQNFANALASHYRASPSISYGQSQQAYGQQDPQRMSLMPVYANKGRPRVGSALEAMRANVNSIYGNNSQAPSPIRSGINATAPAATSPQPSVNVADAPVAAQSGMAQSNPQPAAQNTQIASASTLPAQRAQLGDISAEPINQAQTLPAQRQNSDALAVGSAFGGLRNAFLQKNPRMGSMMMRAMGGE